jgi:hypothetical protein
MLRPPMTVTCWQVRVNHTQLWCDTCNTSSILTVDAYLIYETNGIPDGVRHQGQGTRCVTCQPFTDEEQG